MLFLYLLRKKIRMEDGLLIPLAEELTLLALFATELPISMKTAQDIDANIVIDLATELQTVLTKTRSN